MDDEIKSTPQQVKDYISFMGTVVEKEGLPHLDKTGAARVIEYGAELAGHREKLVPPDHGRSDIIKESAYWAGKRTAK